MEDSCPATPLVLAGRDSKSPLQVALSSPESDGMSPSRDSPNTPCVICLGKLQNKSFTDCCLHQFCFQCLLQWSKIKPECPLCKQPFKSIIHNVKSNLDYDQYYIEHEEPRYVLSDFMHSYNFDLIPVDRRFRYRSTMTREYFRELAESFLAHTRRLPEDTYQISPMVPVDPASGHHVHHSNRRHASSMPHRGGTSDFRRKIYTRDLWVQDLADISGRYRECTPQFYRDNPAQIHRIIPWLNREVNVLLRDCESRVAYVLTRIVSFLTQHSIRSREFRELIQPFFGDRSEHFIHELYTFARSVYDITGFDQHAVYGMNPKYATEVQEISSSNDDSDIEVLETVKTAGKKTKKTTRQGFKKILLKRAGDEASKSDEPVAGPSGINSSGLSEPIEICESDPDEIKVLDYVKPEPEVVTISSGEDSPIMPSLDLSGGEYAEGKPSKVEKSSENENSSDEDYVPSNTKRKTNRKMGKGKCKSNGFGLKGKQKRKYINFKKHRSSSTSSTTSTSSSSSSESSASTTTTTTTSSSTSSSNRSRSSSSSNKSSSKSVSFISCSSSEYKSSSKIKNKKSKVSRKKYKNKTSRKASHKTSENKKRTSGSDSDWNSEAEKPLTRKRKVKSCVIVPSFKSCDSSTTASRSAFSCESPRSSDDSKYRNESQSLAPYWSIAPNSASPAKSRKKRENSSERKSSKYKRKYRESSGEEKSVKRVRDSGSSSKGSFDVECEFSRKHSNGEYPKTSKTCRSHKLTISFNSDNSSSETPSSGPTCDIPSTSTSSTSSNSSAFKVSSTILDVNSD